MSKIDNMSIGEILEAIGLNVDERDMYNVFERDGETFAEWRAVLARRVRDERLSNLSVEKDGFSGDMIKKLFNVEDIPNSVSLSVEDFEPFETGMNKNYLVLLTLYNWQKRLEDGSIQSEEVKRRAKANVKRAIKLIGDNDFDVTDIIYENGHATHITAINSQKLINVIKKSRRLSELEKGDEVKRAKMERIQAKIGLDNIVNVLIERDFREGLTDNETIGGAIADQILFNSIKRYQEDHPGVDVMAELEKESKLLQEEGQEFDDEKELMNDTLYASEAYKTSMAEAIAANYQYIDIDMLLLIASFRYLEALEYNSKRITLKCPTEHEGVEVTEADIVNLIEEAVRKMQEEIEGEPEFIVTYGENGQLEYSKEELRKDLKRFHNGRYIKRAETETEKARLILGEITFANIGEEILRTMEISEEDFQCLIHNSEDNTIYLINHNIIEKDEIMAALYVREICSETLFFVAYQKGLLEYKDIITLFEDGKISGEIISKIEDEELRQKISSYAGVALRDSYLMISDENDAKPEDLEMFVRCIVLYKKFNLEGRTKEEIDSTTFEFISSFEDELSSEILQELYQFGIISLEAAADWGVDLTEMLASNSIKPSDLKDLHARQVISIDEIKNVLIKGNLSYEEKLDLIYSTFDGESEEEIKAREELAEFLNIGDDYKSEGRTGTNRRSAGTEGRKKEKEFITEPHTRWKLLSLLDKDYSKKCLPEGKQIIDGHRVFLLPNHSKVVIERMHEKKKGKRVSAYGSATYVMSIEEFFKNIDEIIKEGSINRTFLREISEGGSATKIIHSKHWGNSIKRQFDINIEGGKYTKEDIEEIDRAIANVENSRKERE